uniref:TRAF-type domain-containing protein n=1 Tax=Trypanosoma congolense (strain IL3000) TaxID=1068625 RepID=G0UKF4_TRYCI|nr:conserved hypothetical protein [Trypanosoma congolense IL3000]
MPVSVSWVPSRNTNGMASKSRSSSISSRQSNDMTSSFSANQSNGYATLTFMQQTQMDNLQAEVNNTPKEFGTTLSSLYEERDRPLLHTFAGGIKMGRMAPPPPGVDSHEDGGCSGDRISHSTVSGSSQVDQRSARLFFASNCDSNTQSASDCDNYGTKSHRTETVSVATQYEPQLCTLCQKVFDDSEDCVQHDKMCPERKVACPLRCGEIFRRCDVVCHVKSQALEHDPMPLPDKTQCPEDHSAFLLPVILNMLLERHGRTEQICAQAKQANDQQSPTPFLPKKICFSDSVASMDASSYRASFTPSGPERERAAGNDSFSHKASNNKEPTSNTRAGVPEPRTEVPLPTSREDDATSTIEKGLTYDENGNGCSENIYTDYSTADYQSSERTNMYVHDSSPKGVDDQSSGVPEPTHVEEASSVNESNEKLVENLLYRIELQHREVEEVLEQCNTYVVASMNKAQRAEVVDAVRTLVSTLDAKSKVIHDECVCLMCKRNINASLILEILHSWRCLDRCWHEVRVSLYDTIGV